MSFFKIFSNALKEHKAQKDFEKKKQTLLNSNTDLKLLEELVRRCNSNPNLIITIHLKDGGIVTLRTEPQHRRKTVSDLLAIDNNIVLGKEK